MKKLMLLSLFTVLILVGCARGATIFEPFTVSGFEIELQSELILTAPPGSLIWGEDVDSEDLADLLESLDLDLPELPEGESTFQIELLSYELEADEVDELDLTFLTPAVDYLFLSDGETTARFEDITFTTAGVFVYEVTQVASLDGAEAEESSEWLLDDNRVLLTVTVIEDLESEELVGSVEQEGELLFVNVFEYDVSELVQEARAQQQEEETVSDEEETSQQGNGQQGSGSSSSSSSGNTGIPEDSAVTVSNSEALSYLALVNRHFRLSSSFSPGDLSVVNVQSTHGTHHLRATAARAAEHLFADAAANGHTLVATSGYRSFATQQATHQHWINERGEAEARRISARPGHSEHQLGLALDITTPALGGLSTQFSSTAEGTWVRNNAHRFGFIIRYPANREADTGFVYEPWHLRYVGVDAATTIHNGNLILEDFLR